MKYLLKYNESNTIPNEVKISNDIDEFIIALKDTTEVKRYTYYFLNNRKVEYYQIGCDILYVININLVPGSTGGGAVDIEVGSFLRNLRNLCDELEDLEFRLSSVLENIKIKLEYNRIELSGTCEVSDPMDYLMDYVIDKGLNGAKRYLINRNVPVEGKGVYNILHELNNSEFKKTKNGVGIKFNHNINIIQFLESLTTLMGTEASFRGVDFYIPDSDILFQKNEDQEEIVGNKILLIPRT